MGDRQQRKREMNAACNETMDRHNFSLTFIENDYILVLYMEGKNEH